MTSDPFLHAANHPLVVGSFVVALALYAVALVVSFVHGKAARWILGAAVVTHLASTVGRGVLIDYFPLTNKMESFSAAALAMGMVHLGVWQKSRAFNAVALAALLGYLGTAWNFGMDLDYPVPLLVTVWYPLHVPLSFLSYGLWVLGGIGGALWFFNRDPALLRDIDRWALWGFGLWSLSMVCGGIWGVLAWGAYFLWDPKILWSVIVWFHYASFVHVKFTPSLAKRPWVRPVLAVLGLIWTFVAYVGTSFFFGDSSHAF